jgi:hypothetical protein
MRVKLVLNPNGRTESKGVWENPGCLKNSFTMVFQMVMCGEYCESVYTYKGVQTIHRSTLSTPHSNFGKSL